jgi:hypothetical protein
VHPADPALTFPEADRPIQGFPFTVAEGLAALQDDEQAGSILRSGCVMGLLFWATYHAPPNPLSPVNGALFGENLGGLTFILQDASGAPSSWTVDRTRTLGGEDTAVYRNRDVWPDPEGPCASRGAPLVSPNGFLARVPPALQHDQLEQFGAFWWSDDDGVAHLYYDAQWRPHDRSHFRSMNLDASTGMIQSLSYIPGDDVDAHQNG